MKKLKLFKKGRRLFFTLALFLLVFAAASVVRVQAADTIMGWLFGGSEDANIGGSLGTWPPDGNETGVGWVSMNYENTEIPNKQTISPYAVTIENGKVSGYAWVNASNAPGSTTSNVNNGLGWIDFNPQDHCVTDANGILDDLSSSGQYEAKNCDVPANADCGKGVFRAGNELEGCARFVSIAQQSVIGNSGGWEGWLKMSGDNYGVDIDSGTGEFCSKANTFNSSTCLDTEGDKCHCYAWNGETDLSATDKNMAEGLGAIDFSRARIEKKCSLGVSPAPPIYVNDGTRKCQKITATLYDNSATQSVIFSVQPADGKVKISENSNCTNAQNSISANIVGNTAKDIWVSATDFSVEDKNHSVEINAGGCGLKSEAITVLKTKNCTISCPDSFMVAPDGKWHSYSCTVGGDVGCIVDTCLKRDGSTKISVKKGSVQNTCDVMADTTARYDTAVSTAVSGSASDDTNINVQPIGWIETNPSN